jgi:hypothetical protein
MRVKIVKSTLPTYWYSNKIGEIFDVVESKYTTDYNLIYEGIPSMIEVGDCVVVEDVVAEQPTRNKYSREIKQGVFVDVYDVLRAFNVTDPCLSHLTKKALAGGQRGHKDLGEDLRDILASAKRAVEMYEEWSDLKAEPYLDFSNIKTDD